MRWPWRKKCDSSEAQEHLKRVLERDPEVRQISWQLREAQRRNHFSEMVAMAIARISKEGN